MHYNTLMETRGNSGLTFGNSELIEANGGVGGGQDYEASSDIQKKIVDACYITPSPGKGWCAMWVSQVYQNAGFGYIGGNACDLYRRYAFKMCIRDRNTMTCKKSLMIYMKIAVIIKYFQI